MTTKRAYKLQEFVAHSSSVNCLKIGRRTSRVLVTGGEDHKVNLWSIGKPNAILSLSGHTSAVESVNFDSSEVLVAAGAANGSIKLWDLEEAKIVRTLTGHRSNCISVDFHPFGEFFASGSSDTNLKIWDIRRKGCIHTFKGHTRGVNAIRFTPDGRWVVSGGEDNCVKLWDLTAGKLLHDFKCHEGQIQCIDFHPHEFLLATGSADRTVKFWDLETFELIGSAGPETTGVRTMTFNPDGRTLLCGLHESLKVFSWEPIICHDAVDVGWSRLSDLKIHEGKLLGCSYNQSCVGVWVVDISLIEPYAISSPARSNGHPELKSTTSGNLHLQTDNSIKANMGSLSVSQNSNTVIKETKTVASTGSIPCTPQRIGLSSGPKMTAANAATSPGVTTLKRSSSKTHGTVNLQIFNRSDVAPVIVPRSSSNVEPVCDSRKETGSGRGLLYTTQSKLTDFPNLSNSRDDLTDVRKLSNSRDDSTDVRKLSDSRDDSTDIRKISHSKDDLTDFRKLSNSRDDSTDFQKFSSSRGDSTNFEKVSNSRDDFTDFRKLSNSRDGLERAILNIQSGSMGSKNTESNEVIDQNYLSALNGVDQPTAAGERNLADVRCIGARKLGVNPPTEPSPSHQHENNDVRLNKPRNTCSVDVQRGGRTRSLVASWERRECSPIYEGPTPSNSSETMSAPNLSFTPRRLPASAETETESAGDEDFIADIMEQHRQFLTTAQSRLSKLQVVYRLWKRKDVRGVINAMEKMSDHAVAADVVSVLIAKSDSVTLDICTCLLPLLISLLESMMDRHLGISLEMLLKLVKIYGPVIHSTISAAPSVGIDLQAEQRLERCNLCFIELEKVKHSLPSLTRRGGSIAKSAQELNLTLQEVL